MSPAAIPSGYEPDDLLRCDACGQLGPEAKMYPHVGTGPDCTAPLALVSPEEAQGIGYVLGSGEVININDDPPGLDMSEPDEVGDERFDELSFDDPEADPQEVLARKLAEAGLAAGIDPLAEQEDDDAEDDDAEDPDAETVASLTGVGQGTHPARLTASPADASLRKRGDPAREKKSLKINAPRPGGARVVRPEPMTASITVPISLLTLSLFEVARTDPGFGFSGTPAQFLDECPQALFEMMGFDGMYLLRRNAAVAQLNGRASSLDSPRRQSREAG